MLQKDFTLLLKDIMTAKEEVDELRKNKERLLLGDSSSIEDDEVPSIHIY